MATTKKYDPTYDYTDASTGTRYIGLNGYGGGSSPTTQPLTTQTNVNATATPNGQYGNTTVASAPTATAQQPSQNVTAGLSTSSKVKTSGSAGYEYEPFKLSGDTLRYKNTLQDLEANKPGPFDSRYEGTIQTILDGILNRKSFDVTTDNNYKSLYDLYSQQYAANADRSMRDTLGASAALTGGYGSTAAQTAAQQAYDTTMQNLNDQSVNLMNLAYGIYQDETADRYNQLNAVEGLDNTDYSRYRDSVSDYYNDLQYYSGRYDQGYTTDYNAWNNDRNFDYTAFTNDRSFDQSEYQTALQYATDLAKSGLSVPNYLTDAIAKYTGKDPSEITGSFDSIMSQALASAKSGGGSGRGGGSGTKTATANVDIPYKTNVRAVANLVEAKKGNTARYLAVLQAFHDDQIDEEAMDILLRDYGINEKSALADTVSADGKKIQKLIAADKETEVKKKTGATLPSSLSALSSTFKYK